MVYGVFMPKKLLDLELSQLEPVMFFHSNLYFFLCILFVFIVNGIMKWEPLL